MGNYWRRRLRNSHHIGLDSAHPTRELLAVALNACMDGHDRRRRTARRRRIGR